MTVEELRVRDPFIFVENGKYFLIGTTGNDCWISGSDLVLYSSCDLKTFTRERELVKKGTLDGYTQIWAPELHRYCGKYYIIVSVFRKDLGRGSMVLVSPSLQEAFTPLTGEYITPHGWWCLDATLFVWKNEPYLFFSNEWIRTVNSDGDGSLYVAKLDGELKTLVTVPKKIISGKGCGFAVENVHTDGFRGYVAEGPFAVEENGKIALYWSTFVKEGYCVAKSIAPDIFGEYGFDKMIFSSDGGHAMVFDDLSGKRKITLHQPNRSPLERMKTFDLT